MALINKLSASKTTACVWNCAASPTTRNYSPIELFRALGNKWKFSFLKLCKTFYKGLQIRKQTACFSFRFYVVVFGFVTPLCVDRKENIRSQILRCFWLKNQNCSRLEILNDKNFRRFHKDDFLQKQKKRLKCGQLFTTENIVNEWIRFAKLPTSNLLLKKTFACCVLTFSNSSSTFTELLFFQR